MLAFSKFRRPRTLVPLVDALKSDNQFLIKFEIPGVTKDNISITADGGVLDLIAKKSEDKYDGFSFLVKERELGEYKMKVNLPDKIDSDRIKASLSDGILTVTIPRAGSSKVNVNIL